VMSVITILNRCTTFKRRGWRAATLPPLTGSWSASGRLLQGHCGGLPTQATDDMEDLRR
jgi:hypothetical protein